MIPKKFTICAGHGGTDPGAVAFGHTERDLMTDFRDILSMKLKADKHTVLNDGARWSNLPLAAALPLIQLSDLAVEFHVNAGPMTAKGVEVLSLPRHKAVSQRIASAISGVMGSPLRGAGGWKPQEESARGRLAFVNSGGLIVELFFISNPVELNTYLGKKWLVASAVAAELSRYGQPTP